jgi:hypothetical protein
MHPQARAARQRTTATRSTSSRAELLRERAERVAVLAARLPEGFHRGVEIGIERRQLQSIGVDRVVRRVVLADAQLVRDVLGQDQAERVADLANSDLGGAVRLGDRTRRRDPDIND